jgi:D-3-phosphoglycerate dehydrogenase / 2-oxoglutarate reductase
MIAMRILVADKLADEGLEFLKQSEIPFDVKVGLKEDELAAAVGGYDALIVRSGAKVTAKVLASPGQLKAIARAGVGVDNIDLDAATAKGILVMNTAEASTLSTAEHALALMMSLARKIPQAHAHVISGQWKRNQYQGTQLAGKTLGVVGLGRIGRAVASRALAMEMSVLGFDPFFSAPTALEGRVSLVRDFDEFLSQVDVITFHVPGGEQTGICSIASGSSASASPICWSSTTPAAKCVDEIALAEALKEKKIAGAAIDVYATEPPAKDHPLFALENAVLTPHLGASTDEAQTAVSVEACKAIVAYLTSGEIRGAVNAGGLKLDLPADERPFAELARRIGALLGGLMRHRNQDHHPPRQRHARPQADPHAAAPGRRRIAPPAPGHGRQRHQRRAHRPEPRHRTGSNHEPNPPAGLVGDIIGVRAEGTSGETHRILGTVYADGLPRILRIDGFPWT